MREHNYRNKNDTLFWNRYVKDYGDTKHTIYQELQDQLTWSRPRTRIRQCKGLCTALGTFVYTHFMFHIVLPLFILSRLFSMFYPIISLFYLNFDVKSVQLLQWLLTIIYVILLLFWMIAFIKCMKFYHWTNHLFPGNTNSAWEDSSWKEYSLKRLNIMQKYYDMRNDNVFMDKKRREMVIDILGKDIGGLIVSYWPKYDFEKSLKKYKEENNGLIKEMF